MLQDDQAKPAGLRRRIVPPAPPAPVPPQTKKTRSAEVDTAKARAKIVMPQLLQRQTSAQPEETAQRTAATAVVVAEPAGPKHALAVQPEAQSATSQASPAAPAQQSAAKTSDAQLLGSTSSMAIATLLSRITGFLRNVLLGATVGPAIGSAFNTANTLPNLITEIVLGAVLTSLVVPVLVRAEKEDADHGAAFIRRLLTMALTLLVVVTVLSVIGAPLLVATFLEADGKVNIVQATSFAYLLLPQILFYGMFSLFMAVLNTKGIFKPGAWAPVINNVVVLAVLLAYQLLPTALDPAEPAGVAEIHIAVLGIGTTLGVIIQAVLLVPPLLRAKIDLRPLWGIDARLRQFLGMGAAIICYVAISQAGYAVANRIASAADADAPMIYNQAWLLLQVPYGIIGVALLTAIMPRLSRNAADGDHHAVVRDLTLATKLTYLALVPIVIFVTVFGVEIAHALFAYGAFHGKAANILGLTVSFSAFTLLPYALVLLHLRVFYAREEAWTPTFIIFGITLTKVLISLAAPFIATGPDKVVIILAAATGFGFITGAAIGVLLLRRKLGSLQGKEIFGTVAWAAGSALVGVVVARGLDQLLVLAAPHLWQRLGSPGQLLRLAVTGTVFLVVTGLVLWRSGLPELEMFGRFTQRIPGLRRTAPAPEVAAAPQQQQHKLTPFQAVAAATVQAQIQTLDPLGTTPIPAPMSGGQVRVPRLVAGAPLANGRFRLLAAHGKVPGASFWRARDLQTGRDVALTFVSPTETLTRPNQTQVAGIVAEIARKTKNVGAVVHPALASGLHIFTHRSGAIIVTDWTPGIALRSLIGTDTNAEAAVASLVPLADVVAQLHEASRPLGLNSVDQIRITPDGVAVYAFPVVLPGTQAQDDVQILVSALTGMVKKSNLTAKLAGLEQAAFATDERALQATDLAAALAEAIGQAKQQPETLQVAPETAAVPDERPRGFGSRGYSARAKVLLVALVVAVVLGAAAVAGAILASLGQHDFDHATNPPASPSGVITFVPPVQDHVGDVIGPASGSPTGQGVDVNPKSTATATVTVPTPAAVPSSVLSPAPVAPAVPATT